MTCKHCCGADRLFDLKGARKELKKYKKKGPGKVTSKLIEQIVTNGIKQRSLLDIGGGIGAIQWAFLQGGGLSTTDVDASLGYITVAKSYANEKNFEQNAHFLHGDFVDQYQHVANADFVTLDKVICCYPEYRSLLQHALEKCDNIIGLSYPVGGLFLKMFALLNKVYFYLKKNPFRSYVHSPREVEQFIFNHGFELVEKSVKFPWHIQSYRRVDRH